jgi:CBS domain containing-hemolysin-like protein
MTFGLLGVGLLLVVLNGFYVAAEFSLMATRRTELEGRAEQGDRRARSALAAMTELPTMLAGAQLGITMASLGLGFVAEPALEHVLGDALHPFHIPEGFEHAISLAIALSITTFFHTVLGEMVPKNIAISAPSPTLLLLAPAFRAYVLVFRPVVAALNWMGNATVRLLGVHPRAEFIDAHTTEEIAAILAEARREGSIDLDDHQLLARALGIGSLDARAVMVPRPDVVALPRSAPVTAFAEATLRTGHTRIPVYEGTVDQIDGFVHAKDLLALDPAALEDPDAPLPGEVVRTILVVPESVALDDLLLRMRRERRHLALVVDEHGGSAGIVTLEDILEELVGEITDEFDQRTRRTRRAGGRFLAPGGLRGDELADEVGLHLPEGDYETVAGFLLAELGRIPDRGDEVHHDGWTIQVRRMDGHRVDLVALLPPPGHVAPR